MKSLYEVIRGAAYITQMDKKDWLNPGFREVKERG
jgi:hypothetical protein